MQLVVGASLTTACKHTDRGLLLILAIGQQEVVLLDLLVSACAVETAIAAARRRQSGYFRGWPRHLQRKPTPC